MALIEITPECRNAIDRWDGTYGAPSAENRKTPALKVLKNDFLERFIATSHPILPGVWFGPPIVIGLYVGLTASPGPALGLFAAGILFWTLLEYVLHRFVFHMRPKTPAAKYNQFMMHGYHHQFPNDRLRLVAPPIMSWPLAIVVAGLMRLALGPVWWWPLFAGTAFGYLAYDWIHYYTHHFTPTTALGKRLRRAHMVHHFADPESNHGISNPLWDFVLGTYRSSTESADRNVPNVAPRAHATEKQPERAHDAG